MTSNDVSQLNRIKKISTLLDSQFDGPMGIKFGLDPLVGLIPVVGDGVTTLISFYLVIEAYYLGCSPAILLRMTFNIFLEDAIKVIPLVGQVFDFYWKSNLKNLKLIEDYFEKPRETQQRSKIFLAVLITLFVVVFLSLAMASVALVVWLLSQLGSHY